MDRRFPAKLVGFVEGSAIVALVVALLLQAFPISGINDIAVEHVFLWIAFGICVAILLELAIIRFPGLAGPQSALLLLLLGLLGFAGWAVSAWINGHDPQQRTAKILEHLPSGDSAPPSPAAVRPTENISHDNTSEPRAQQNEDRDTTDRQITKAAINPEPCVIVPMEESNHHSSSDCRPPKLPAITPRQRDAIRDAMKPYAGLRFTLLRENSTKDSDKYADQIEAALLGAGLINSSDRDITQGGILDPAGVSLIVGSKESNAADSMSSGMRRAGLILFSLPTSQSSSPEDFQIIVAPNH